MFVRDSKTDFTNVSSDGIFQGYAVKWDSEYHDGTSIKRGAFKKSLEECGMRGIKMLSQHDDTAPVGRWLELREDDVGLFVRGQLNLDLQLARDVLSNMTKGILDGLSIGYAEYTGEDVVTDLDLIEISIVTFPSMEEATVDTMNFTDEIVLDKGSVRRTRDGYLTALARVARTGIQVYKGSEVGRPDLDTVRVYRSPTEVFRDTALRSIAHRPVTNGHPPEPVTAKNWRKYAVGNVGDEVIRDGKSIRVPLTLMDQDVISAYEKDEKKQLSMGYTTDLKWQDGVSPEGEAYDAVQTNIRANHVAVVVAGRAGSDYAIGDENGEGRMTTQTQNGPAVKSFMVDSIPVNMDDASYAVVTRALAGIEQRAKDLQKKLDAEEEDKKKAKTAKDAADEALKVKDAEIVTLKQQLADSVLTPAKLNDAIRVRVNVIDKAKAIMGDNINVGDKSDADIRKMVVDSKLAATETKDWKEPEYSAAFNMLTATVRDGSGNQSSGRDVMADALSGSRTVDARTTSYQTYDNNVRDAWKGSKPGYASQQNQNQN